LVCQWSRPSSHRSVGRSAGGVDFSDGCVARCGVSPGRGLVTCPEGVGEAGLVSRRAWRSGPR
jgi:hypothetical protein